MQNYIRYTAFQTGLRQLVISIWSLILGPVTGILGNKFSKWMISGASAAWVNWLLVVGQRHDDEANVYSIGTSNGLDGIDDECNR